MSDDLYGILGVERTADEKAIKRAYRSKAKRAHPDSGGSAEAFEKVQGAYAVLTDQSRRAEYDKTGKVGDKEPEGKTFVRAMHLLTKMFMELLATNAELRYMRVVAEMTSKVEEELQVLKDAIRRDEGRRAKVADAAKRTIAKAGKDNVLRAMFEKMGSDMDRHLANLQVEVEVFKMALDILARHDWNRDTVVTNPFTDADTETMVRMLSAGGTGQRKLFQTTG